MLAELKLRNFAIIDDISISFGNGLNIITGETGTGKSLIIDAINIILGDKLTADHVKSEEKEASIEALFHVPDGGHVHKKLEESGIEISGGEVVVKRIFPPGGRGRIYINGSFAPLAVLSEITGGLVEMFGQHEHQNLLKKNNYLSYIDIFSELEHEVSEYKKQYSRLADIRGKIEVLERSRREGSEKADYLKFQIEEIKNISPVIGEDLELEREKTILENSEKFSSSVRTATELVYEGKDSAIDSLKSAVSCLEEVSKLDSSLGELRDRINGLIIEAEDIFYGLREFCGEIEHSPQRLEEVVSRFEEIKKLKRKHGDSVAEVLEKLRLMESELESAENSEELLEKLEEERTLLEKDVHKAAEAISTRRKDEAGRLEELFSREVESVGLKNARFEVEFGEKEISADGLDRVDFLFSANPGQRTKSVSKVASGGELSRIMLTLKSLVLSGGEDSIFIFDEADAGIGGVVAETIGGKIRELSRENQVICITHLPQVAKFADTHLRVDKSFEDEKTKVSVNVLDEQNRVEEIGRMLAGRSVSEKTFEVAAEMIRGAM